MPPFSYSPKVKGLGFRLRSSKRGSENKMVRYTESQVQAFQNLGIWGLKVHKLLCTQVMEGHVRFQKEV